MITRKSVAAAFKKYDSGALPTGRSQARAWHVVGDESREYPLKHIYHLASKERVMSFHTQTAKKSFEDLGFEVIKKDATHKNRSKIQVFKTWRDLGLDQAFALGIRTDGNLLSIQESGESKSSAWRVDASKAGHLAKVLIFKGNSANITAELFLGTFVRLDFAEGSNGKKTVVFDDTRFVGTTNSSWVDFSGQINQRASLVYFGQQDYKGPVFNGKYKSKIPVFDESIVTGILTALAKLRKGQSKLRNQTLRSYGNRCAVCPIDDPKVLIAAHIVPWQKDLSNSGTASNVMSLCAVHDKLFENGYWSLNDNLLPVVSHTKKLSKEIRKLVTDLRFNEPTHFPPAAQFLQWHRKNHGLLD
jgi:HNH endonuclease